MKYGSYSIAGGVAGWQSYFGDTASSKTFWKARARSLSSGKLVFPHGTLSLLIGRARVVPSHTPERSGTAAGDDGVWARSGAALLAITARTATPAATVTN